MALFVVRARCGCFYNKKKKGEKEEEEGIK